MSWAPEQDTQLSKQLSDLSRKVVTASLVLLWIFYPTEPAGTPHYASMSPFAFGHLLFTAPACKDSVGTSWPLLTLHCERCWGPAKPTPSSWSNTPPCLPPNRKPLRTPQEDLGQGRRAAVSGWEFYGGHARKDQRVTEIKPSWSAESLGLSGKPSTKASSCHTKHRKIGGNGGWSNPGRMLNDTTAGGSTSAQPQHPYPFLASLGS